jgi:hypothetical protein
MVDQAIEFLKHHIDSSKLILVLTGIVGFFLKVVTKYIQKKLEEIEKLQNEVKDIANKVEIYDLRQEGRDGFTTTISDLNVRVKVLEELERRQNNVPINFKDRRREKENETPS